MSNDEKDPLFVKTSLGIDTMRILQEAVDYYLINLPDTQPPEKRRHLEAVRVLLHKIIFEHTLHSK